MAPVEKVQFKTPDDTLELWSGKEPSFFLINQKQQPFGKSRADMMNSNNMLTEEQREFILENYPEHQNVPKEIMAWLHTKAVADEAQFTCSKNYQVDRFYDGRKMVKGYWTNY